MPEYNSCMNFTLPLPISVNILPINIEKIVDDLHFEFNKGINKSSGDVIAELIKQAFVEFLSYSSQLPPKNASRSAMLIQREGYHDQVRQAERSAMRMHGNTSVPQQVFMAKQNQVRPMIQMLMHDQGEAEKCYKLETGILTSLTESLNSEIRSSDMPQEEKGKAIAYVTSKATTSIEVLKRKYSVDDDQT